MTFRKQFVALSTAEVSAQTPKGSSLRQVCKLFRLSLHLMLYSSAIAILFSFVSFWRFYLKHKTVCWNTEWKWACFWLWLYLQNAFNGFESLVLYSHRWKLESMLVFSKEEQSGASSSLLSRSFYTTFCNFKPATHVYCIVSMVNEFPSSPSYFLCKECRIFYALTKIKKTCEEVGSRSRKFGHYH